MPRAFCGDGKGGVEQYKEKKNVLVVGSRERNDVPIYARGVGSGVVSRHIPGFVHVDIFRSGGDARMQRK
jgi:hypothetical protein